jgi:hypothetical protein
MPNLFVRCWRALGHISLMDWLLGFVKLSVLGLLSGLWASLEGLPPLVIGLVVFTCGYVIWTAIQVRRIVAATATEPNGNNLALAESRRKQDKQDLERIRLTQRSERGRIHKSESNTPTFISMQEAATRLYESPVKIAGVPLSRAAEKFGGITPGAASPNERLEYLARFIVQKELDIFGAKPPSRVVEKIDPAEVKRASFWDGATVLRDKMYDKSIYWVDLCVKADQLDALIGSLCESEAEFDKAFSRASLSHDDAKLLLARLRGEGVVIRNDVPPYLLPDEFVAWQSKVTGWMNEVIETIKVVSAADSEWFTTLDAVPAARVPIPNIRLATKEDLALFTSVFRQHDFRLKRLNDLLKKYGVGAE